MLAALLLAALAMARAFRTNFEVVAAHPECAQAYATALTAADTARVDRLIVAFPAGGDPVRCGPLRRREELLLGNHELDLPWRRN